MKQRIFKFPVTGISGSGLFQSLEVPRRVMTGLLAAGLLAGCGHKGELADGHGHSHGDDAESFSGATHREGKGITLLEETRGLLGVQTVEVREQILTRQIGFVARVAGGLAVGAVSTNDAALLRAGMVARFTTASGVAVTGEVRGVSRLVADDDAEAVVAFGPEGGKLRPGEFGEISIAVPGGRASLVVPEEAVIRGATGDLVYAVNGDAYLLTWVTVGARAGGLVEILDGLLEGDAVVTRGAMDLWLVELRALKGGQGCCPAPPKKEKG